MIDLFLLRRAFAPLRRLTQVVRAVDPLRPGRRIEVDSNDGEIVSCRAFNQMLDRLERERREKSWNVGVSGACDEWSQHPRP